MATLIDPDDIVGASEIADRLGVSSSVVHDWQRRYEEFPDPIRRLRMGLVWAWPQIEAWARETGRVSDGDAPRG